MVKAGHQLTTKLGRFDSHFSLENGRSDSRFPVGLTRTDLKQNINFRAENTENGRFDSHLR